MARVTALRRHRAGIASGVALAVATTVIAVYAVSADGYKKHEAELNDGGVWVVNGKKGWSGRLNKPINQLDGVVPGDNGKARLDVVQDGAAVVTLDAGTSRGQVIETSRLEAQDGGSAAIPVTGDVAMAGGSLATADAETGEVWAVRYDDELGKPVVSAVDRQAEPLAEAGEGAALTVSQSGTVVVTSTEESTVTTLAPTDAGFRKPRTRDLSDDAGQVSDVTTVGDRIVTLDADAGVLSVVGGATVSVTPGSRLQQPGPAYDAVLVGAPDGLLSVDLESGDVTTVSDRSGTSAVEPVRLGACVYGAWSGGLGAVAVQCGSQEVMEDDLAGNATSLAFRVNRGEIVLNDANSGTVWDVQQDKPIRIDNWEAFTSKKKNKDDDEENENQTDADRRPPRAKPDSYGVRAGRTTVLHPLDNDSAPDGRLLSIVDVDQPSGGARVEISPDGQTLVLEMPEDGRPARFDYFIDDGRNGLSANAAVDVSVRGTEQNEPPALREGWKKPTYKVPHNGELAVPVLGDWRDDSDGDTLLLESAKAVGGEESGAAARTTADGRIRFTAPSGPADGSQLVRVEFAVTDGRSAPVTKSMGFQVQAPKDQKSYAPQAEPDVVRGEVGKPIKIRPLLNDLPGSDPNATDAELSLGGKVPQQPDAKVVTDLDAGQLTFTGERAGTYFLSYDAAFGNAPLDQGTIRVDVKASPKRAADPIAMPDTLTVYGQAPGIVDVLANDLDPAGGLLVVQRAVGDRADQLDVAIVDGRWLRISATRPDLAPATQTVSYTISNGTSSAVRGEVVVTQRPAPEDNTPITVSDKVVVRAGGSVAAPVLDNDVSPAGDRLTLLNDLSSTDTPGQLAVVAPIDVTGDVGKAFVSGRVVRYVAPEKVEERDTYTVKYVAQNLEGKRADGTLKVTVVPADDPNDAPEPPTLEGRVVSGDTVKVRVPGVGVDRNGDPVTVTGITSAPAARPDRGRRRQLPRVRGLPAHGRHRRVHLLRRRLAGRLRDRHGPGGRRRAGPAPAAAGGRGPAHRRAGTHRDVRPARQRLHRLRRLGRGRDPRRSGRCPPRPRHQPGDGAGARLRGRPADRARLPGHQRHRRVTLDDDADHGGGLRQPADRSTTPSAGPTTAGASWSTSSRAPTTRTVTSRTSRSSTSPVTRRPGWSTGCRSVPTVGRRRRCCPSRCATPTARPPPRRSTSRPRATACPTSCPGRSSSSTPARAPPAR